MKNKKLKLLTKEEKNQFLDDYKVKKRKEADERSRFSIFQSVAIV